MVQSYSVGTISSAIAWVLFEEPSFPAATVSKKMNEHSRHKFAIVRKDEKRKALKDNSKIRVKIILRCEERMQTTRNPHQTGLRASCAPPEHTPCPSACSKSRRGEGRSMSLVPPGLPDAVCCPSIRCCEWLWVFLKKKRTLLISFQKRGVKNCQPSRDRPPDDRLPSVEGQKEESKTCWEWKHGEVATV